MPRPHVFNKQKTPWIDWCASSIYKHDFGYEVSTYKKSGLKEILKFCEMEECGGEKIGPIFTKQSGLKIEVIKKCQRKSIPKNDAP